MIRTEASYAYSLDTKDELAYLRDRFVFKDPEMIYLDGNSLGRLPRATASRIQDLVEKEWGRRLIRGWGEGWFEMPRRVGAKVALLIGAQPDEVLVTDSTSVNLYKLALAALQAQPRRRKIITDDLNFPSDVYILQGIAKLVDGCSLEIVPSADGIHGPADALLNALDDDTALLTLSHTLYKSSYVYDMAHLTEQAHQAGALVLWDLSHSAGSVPVRLNECKADLAVGCTYKYLNGGPGSPAFLYVRRSLQEAIGNPLSGWMGQKNLFDLELDYTPAEGIQRYMTGTPTILSLAAVETGVDILLEAGMEHLRAKSVQQTEYFIALFREFLEPLGFRLQTPADPNRRGSHVSIGHADAWRINQALINEMHVLPDFRAPDNLRMGIAPVYTSFTDLHTAVMRLRTIVVEGLHEKYSHAKTTIT